MTAILAGLAVLFSAGCLYGWRRNRKMYRIIDRMLDEVLDGEPISQSDIREGEISSLASKAKRIQEKVDGSISQAQEEKEQVKSLISNMSHQLKTPLAGLMMYREMLEEDGLDHDTRRKFLKKMKQQSEKIDWILQSLFKMVNLEQGAVVFEAGPLPVKATILDAVTAVWDRADGRNISIVTEPFADWILWHNRKWTAEVLVNILENAVKYTSREAASPYGFVPRKCTRKSPSRIPEGASARRSLRRFSSVSIAAGMWKTWRAPASACTFPG